MIARSIWWAVLSIIAVVTVFAQLDRSTRFTPSYSVLVPQAFAGFAAERTAQRAVLAQEGEASLAAARALVAARPVPAEHLTLLAQAQIQAGQNDAAIATLEAATKRGWRDPLAQMAAAQAALADGAHEAAALRLNALFATGLVPDQSAAGLAILLTSEGGREAFAQRLAGEGRWQDALLNRVRNEIAPADLAPTLALAQEQGAELSCGVLQRIADQYSEAGLIAEAQMVDPGACP